MISIAMFNNKGGVGKTTLVCNLAAYLAAHKNAKVLVFDADPQCNTSTYVLDDDYFNKIYYDGKGDTINNLIIPVAKGDGFVKSITPYKGSNFKFDVIPGSPKLALAEDLLASDWSDVRSSTIRGTKTTLVFSHALSFFKEYDYVFFDMGPSLGAINRSILLACDYFLTPMSSDIFSILALENIGKRLCEWIETFNAGAKKIEKAEPGSLKSLKQKVDIQFLGYVTQQYTAKTVKKERVPVNAYEKIINRIPEAIRSNIIEQVNSKERHSYNGYSLGTIPTFNSIIPMSQHSHTPIFSLSTPQGVRGSHFSKVKEYRDIIEKITSSFLNSVREFTQ